MLVRSLIIQLKPYFTRIQFKICDKILSHGSEDVQKTRKHYFNNEAHPIQADNSQAKFITNYLLSPREILLQIGLTFKCLTCP